MRLHPKLPMTIVFSILRSLLLTIILLVSLLLPGPASPLNPLSPLKRFDVFIVDQQSVCVPLLRLVSGSRVVFYCHFPDKLLSAGWTIGENGKSVRREGGLLRRIYRWPVDKLEEWTTGMQFPPSMSRKLRARSIRCYSRQFEVHLRGLRQRVPITGEEDTQSRLSLYRPGSVFVFQAGQG